MDHRVTTTTAVVTGAGVALLISVLAVYLLSRSRGTSRRPTLLTSDPSIRHNVPLIEKIPISPDTYNFRFGLPSPDHVLGLPVGQHVIIHALIDGEPVSRKYTPVTSDEDKGHFDLVIKVYKSQVNPRFPDGGKMTQFVDGMAIGDLLPVSGPVGRLRYLGKGKFTMFDKKTKTQRSARYTELGMIAGGSGIAPMLQLIEAVLREPLDSGIKRINLLFANQTEKDILMRERLEQLVGEHRERLKIWYTVDRPEDGDWRYSTGFVNAGHDP